MRPVLTMFAVAAGLALAVPGNAAAQKRSRDRLTHEEIMSSSQKDQTLFLALRALKPHFLEPPRGTRSFGAAAQEGLLVYVDGRRASGGDVLGSIMAADVEEVRYLDPTRSQNEYGINANGGALQIKLIKRDAKADTAKKP